MILEVIHEYLPFPTESDLAVDIPDDFINPSDTGSSIHPIEMILADKKMLSIMVKTDSYFEISAEDMDEIKEKQLIVWPVTEHLFKIKEEA